MCSPATHIVSLSPPVLEFTPLLLWFCLTDKWSVSLIIRCCIDLHRWTHDINSNHVLWSLFTQNNTISAVSELHHLFCAFADIIKHNAIAVCFGFSYQFGICSKMPETLARSLRLTELGKTLLRHTPAVCSLSPRSSGSVGVQGYNTFTFTSIL